MNRKNCKVILLSLIILVSQTNTVFAVNKKSDNGLRFDNNMEYKRQDNFVENELVTPEMEDLMNKVKSMRESGAWSLHGDEQETAPEPSGDSIEDNTGEHEMGSTDPGERVSNDSYEIAKSLGPIMFPIRNFSGRMSSHFGKRKPPVAGASTYHQGIDVPCNSGTPLVAMMDGTISENGTYRNGANYVAVAHKNGVTTRYLHLSKRSKLKIGTKVKQGEVIAYAGNTGVGSGPHLHLEIQVKGLKNGEYKGRVNPLHGFIDPNHVKASSCPRGGKRGGLDQKDYDKNYRGNWIN